MEVEDVAKIYPMLPVEEAQARVLSRIHRLEREEVRILDALGRVAAEDVTADYDIPPHTNTAMDGYAVRTEDTAGASPENPVRLQVIGELAAGYVAEKELAPGTAIRIMTGAPIPPGADAIVRFEQTRQDGAYVEILTEVTIGKEVRPAGEDVRSGDTVISQGRILRPQEIGMLAALGKKTIVVTRRPRVGILATGDELVGIDEPLSPGKIRNSNTYSNAAQVKKYGGIPVLLGIARDREGEISDSLRAGLTKGMDLILVSGGVSVGDFDVVKKVLAGAGEIDFWQVRMKPGKPLAFGYLNLGGKDVPVIGTPGNPVSTMISFELFARPLILSLLGARDIDPFVVWARLADRIAQTSSRRHYARVRLEEKAGEYLAYLTGDQGSGILSSMVNADGLAVIPEDWDNAEAGALVRVIPFGGT
ncbi:MAG: gephyrin-like molybdotransferase Glp [Candidatus Bipolaricaulota bacterium]|nr:gephyrin-like molybdotransferase Glp [Candidatus Bipolaricaulota bacterium]